MQSYIWCIKLGESEDIGGLVDAGAAYGYHNGEYLIGTNANPTDFDWSKTPYSAWTEILNAKSGSINVYREADGTAVLGTDYYHYNVTVS